jgi:hypothetical protein
MDERIGDAIADGMDWGFRQLTTMPRRIFGRLVQRLPLAFRVLYQQFLLRVIDLESLSIEADIPRFLGQFAGIVLMFSLIRAVGMLFFPPPPTAAVSIQQSQLSLMMLIVGLITVITWDSIFPDRRDVMVLAPLPVRPHTILFAKLAASAGLIGLAIVCFNCASSFAVCGLFAGPAGFSRCFLAWWFSMTACSAFLYCTVLTIQGLTALLLPRGLFLRLSAVLQLAAFALFLGAYFLSPTLPSLADFIPAANHKLVAGLPTYWFVALFNQLNGRLPSQLTWLAARAWIALGIVVAGSALSLALCYYRTMRKTIEQPDLVPGARSLRLPLPLGHSLAAAIANFCIRSITRSRQHRLLLAFFWSVILAISLGWIRDAIRNPPQPISLDFLMSTFMMMSFGVLGLRAISSLPISLHANWMLRTTQLRSTTRYIGATRLCFLLFGAAPVWIICAAISAHLTPWQAVAKHLAFLAVFGCGLVELGLIRFYKVPFTCSYLPGKANIQVIFWGFVFVFLILAFTVGNYELATFSDEGKYVQLMVLTGAAAAGMAAYNQIKARTAVLYFEELPPEILTRLGLVYVPPAEPNSGSASSR